MPESAVVTLAPHWVVPGGRVRLTGVDLPLGVQGPPRVLVGDRQAHVRAASIGSVTISVPLTVTGGPTAIRFDPGPDAGQIVIARSLATGLHMVDSPVFDSRGRLYVTHSGGRGVKASVPLYRIGPDGTREPVAVDVSNPTSMAAAPDGSLFISSRFEGHVYRLTPDDGVDIYASDLGVPTGLAVAADGTLFVGDRSGTVFRVSPTREVDTFASLPPSVAAFHLALGPDGSLYVAAPTLASHDAVYRVTPDRRVDTVYGGFGRPQGLAFDSEGRLYVADALAGDAGLYRLDSGGCRAEARARRHGADARRRRVRSRRRGGARLERHDLAARRAAPSARPLRAPLMARPGPRPRG